MSKRILLFALISFVFTLTLGMWEGGLAEETCTTYWDPVTEQNVIVCTGTTGGPGGGSTPAPPPPPGGSCPPGQTYVVNYYVYSPALDACVHSRATYDCETGQEILFEVLEMTPGQCSPPPPNTPPVEIPCLTYSWGSSIICNSRWQVQATVPWPPMYLDVKPYPASLVRWPTSIRNGGLGASSGSGTLDYVPYGYGLPENPAVGDWRNLTLTLTLSPMHGRPLTVNLPHVILSADHRTYGESETEEFDLYEQDPAAHGNPTLFHWDVPSHPAVGGSILASEVPGINDWIPPVEGTKPLPDDIPMFTGSAKAPYQLFWSLTYQEYTARTDRLCSPGPIPGTGNTYQCQVDNQSQQDDGHYICQPGLWNGNDECDPGGANTNGYWERTTVYEWQNRTRGGEIMPYMVFGLPACLYADIQNDGYADGFWNYNLTIRRMHGDSNVVDDPVWGGTWNWWGGGASCSNAIYWAVREGQGQIGWPGVP